MVSHGAWCTHMWKTSSIGNIAVENDVQRNEKRCIIFSWQALKGKNKHYNLAQRYENRQAPQEHNASPWPSQQQRKLRLEKAKRESLFFPNIYNVMASHLVKKSSGKKQLSSGWKNAGPSSSHFTSNQLHPWSAMSKTTVLFSFSEQWFRWTTRKLKKTCPSDWKSMSHTRTILNNGCKILAQRKAKRWGRKFSSKSWHKTSLKNLSSGNKNDKADSLLHLQNEKIN